MKKISFLLTCIVLWLLSGCVHGRHTSSFTTPITVPVQTIQSTGSFIDQPFNEETIAALETELEQIVLASGVNGISACVGVPEDGIWCSARGGTGDRSRSWITSDLQFSAGSIGKMFTAVVVLSLIEEGRLDLDDSVEKWFPEIAWAHQVTINHLLTHTSGIAGFDNAAEYESCKELYLVPDELISYLSNKKLLFQPGKHYAYSNIGYIMLGSIIERVGESRYDEAVNQHILNKLNLRNTVVIAAEGLSDLDVKGHHDGNVLSGSETPVVPSSAGSIAATPKDLILFLHALMSGKLLSQASLQTLFADMNLMAATQSTYYGKGVVAALGTPVGNIVGHTGAMKGFGASLYYHPKKNIFVCVMMNDDRRGADPAMFRLLETMMEL